jgi:hypothetical protein
MKRIISQSRAFRKTKHHCGIMFRYCCSLVLVLTSYFFLLLYPLNSKTGLPDLKNGSADFNGSWQD